MASDTVSTVKILETYGYASVIIITIVGYDYILTFSREIDTVWRRPWTFVSTLFLIIRYVGLCWVVTLALAGGIFVPGPVDMIFQGIAVIAVGDWGYMIFLAAADLMILRVAALWGRSRIILCILFLIYVPQMVITVVWDAAYENPGKSLAVGIYRVLNFSLCSYTSSTAPLATYRAVPRFILGSLLLVLAVIPTLKESISMYRITKHWQINRTTELLIREGAVYFVVNLLFNIVNMIRLPIVSLMLILDALGYALSCAIMPRFIFSIRELYDRDVEERWRGIDTGFGRYANQSCSTREDVSTTAIVDVSIGGDQGNEVGFEDVEDDAGRI